MCGHDGRRCSGVPRMPDHYRARRTSSWPRRAASITTEVTEGICRRHLGRSLGERRRPPERPETASPFPRGYPAQVTEQTHLAVASPGPDRDDEDRHAMAIVEHVLDEVGSRVVCTKPSGRNGAWPTLVYAYRLAFDGRRRAWRCTPVRSPASSAPGAGPDPRRVSSRWRPAVSLRTSWRIPPAATCEGAMALGPRRTLGPV